MIYTENAINILTAKTYKGIGRAWIIKNLKGNESVETIVSLLNNKSKQEKEITIYDFELNKNQILEKVLNLGDSCDGIVAIGDKNFPKHFYILQLLCFFRPSLWASTNHFQLKNFL